MNYSRILTTGGNTWPFCKISCTFQEGRTIVTSRDHCGVLIGEVAYPALLSMYVMRSHFTTQSWYRNYQAISRIVHGSNGYNKVDYRLRGIWYE